MTTSLHWLIQIQKDVPEYDRWLSEGERKILEGLRFPKRRNDWRLGRWTAKQAICGYGGKDASSLPSLEIRAASDGSPEVFWKDGPGGVSISISHSRDMGLCVVGPAGLAVGCDLEWMEPREVELVEDYFTAEEISYVKQTPAVDRQLTVNLIWSAKETILKILREGLRRDTRSVSVLIDPETREDQWNAWSGRCLESSRKFCGWWRSLQGYVLTLGSDQPNSIPKPLIL